MSKLNPTVEEYRAHIHAFDQDLLDFVATYAEWGRFKEAVRLWVADVDDEYDRLARDEEHGHG